MNDKNEQANGQQNESDLQPCCDGGSCCQSGSDGRNKSWKIAVFILIVLAAGAVLARSLLTKSDSPTEQDRNTFAAIQPEIMGDTPPEATMQNPTASNEASPALWGPELDSLG